MSTERLDLVPAESDQVYPEEAVRLTEKAIAENLQPFLNRHSDFLGPEITLELYEKERDWLLRYFSDPEIERYQDG
jgi:hypothetical protein